MQADPDEPFRILDAIPLLCWMAHPDGHIYWYNRGWYEYTRTTLEQMEGWGWKSVHDPALVDSVTEKWKRSLATGEALELEFPLRRADGVFRWHLTRAVPVRDPDGRIVRWIGSNTDIEDARRAREAEAEHAKRLAVALQRAEQASGEKDEFLAMLAHELRNPLAPMMNATALLKMDASGATQARARDVLDRQVHHLARLVDDLLETSRIARGKIELKPEPVDLAALVQEIVSDFATVIRDAGIRVSMRSPDEPLTLRADRTRITQAISNLLGNAIKFTPAGGTVGLEIECTGAGKERLAELTVRDSGVGIDPGFLHRIFDPFTQADASLDRSRGGLGLGLAVARGIVELHGGTLTADSEGPGKGATFRMRLPLSGVPAACEPDRADLRRPAGGLRVMVVEDNVDQGDTMQELLESFGHVVHLERSGERAVEAIRRLRPDVVLCDLGLPGKNGFAIASEIRRDPALRALKLVAISGYGGAEDRARAAEVGFDRHFTKPVDPAKLEELLAAP